MTEEPKVQTAYISLHSNTSPETTPDTSGGAYSKKEISWGDGAVPITFAPPGVSTVTEIIIYDASSSDDDDDYDPSWEDDGGR